MKRVTNINPITAFIVCSIFVAVVAIIAFLINYFSAQLHYENIIKIDNFSKYFTDVPSAIRDSTFSELYDVVKLNLGDNKMPEDGAVIRDDTLEITEDPDTKIKTGSFIVDLPSIGQSYRATMNWPGGDIAVSGYVATMTCLDESKLIYGNFDCVDEFSQTNNSEVPICNKLPLGISEYDVASRSSRSYSISCYFESKDEAKILINDFSGGNYENALNKIRELGFNPDDYTIEYNDQGGNFNN